MKNTIVKIRCPKLKSTSYYLFRLPSGTEDDLLLKLFEMNHHHECDIVLVTVMMNVIAIWSFTVIYFYGRCGIGGRNSNLRFSVFTNTIARKLYVVNIRPKYDNQCINPCTTTTFLTTMTFQYHPKHTTSFQLPVIINPYTTTLFLKTATSQYHL